MRKTVAMAVIAVGASIATPASAVWRDNQTVGHVQGDARPCMFFSLVGVAQADPVVPNEQFFAISTSNAGYQIMSSILMSAKLANRKIYVNTTGATACGYATVDVVGLQP